MPGAGLSAFLQNFSTGEMVVIAIVALGVLGRALRRVLRTPSPHSLVRSLGPAQAAAADLDAAAAEFRAAVDDRTGR